MKKLGSFITLLICFFVFAKVKAVKDETLKPKMFSGKWEINCGVAKLYNTPMGEVFKFSPSPKFSGDRRSYDAQINSIQFNLFKNSKERNEMRRFIVIDLKIRVFPATSEVKNPSLTFSFTRSTNSANFIKKYCNINGIRINDYAKSPFWRGPQGVEAKLLNNSPEVCKWSGNVGLPFLPAYEIISMRLVIDTNQEGFVSSNVNGALNISRHREFFPNKRYPVCSFGILMESESKRKKENRLILEVSTPEIFFTDNEADLLGLPSIKPEEYPYSGYVEMLKNSKRKKRNLKRLDNPDAIYGNALHLLAGKDLVEGVKLLTYIAKKHDHVFAMNQLGICYWRGIGVKPDIQKALKWFKRAGKYNLPDALAYGGALCLKETSKPYIKENDKKYIYYALNHNTIAFNKGKHATSVLSAILNYSTPSEAKEYKRSPKLGYWMAKNFHIRAFYRNSLYEDKGIIPKESGMTGRYINNKFYDYRATNTPLWRTGLAEITKQTLDVAVKAGFPAAIYFKGQLLIAQGKKEEMESVLKEAMSLFKRGEKLGDLECAIEVLHCKTRLGELKPEDFSNESFVKFSDHPLYYLLKYMVKNPNAPGVKEFLNCDYKTARRIWHKKTNGMSHFLCALERIYQYYHYGADTALYRIYYGDIRDIKMAYEHLNVAVKAKIADAMYLKGVYLLNKKYNSFSGIRNGDISAGIDLLRKVAPTNIKAQYYIIKNSFYNNRSMDRKWLQQLKPLRDLNFPDAWLLSCDILARLSRGNATKREKVIGAYKKTALLGCYQAWDRLAMLYYQNGKASETNKAKAEEYWKKYLEADKRQRSFDPLDPYWPKPLPAKAMTLAFGDYGPPVPGGTMGIAYSELVSWLRKYYKIIGSPEKDKQHPPNIKVYRGLKGLKGLSGSDPM